ncbi:Transmembrane protein 231 [Trinorchestia longiramus]|nr:Transmembrane protein 231 [Trinorchestia longiramus]
METDETSTMLSFTVYTDPKVVLHRTILCSRATFFSSICFLVAVIVPLLVTYKSKGLWMREYRDREQPAVIYMEQLLMVAQTSSGPLYWGTDAAVRDLNPRSLRQPHVTWHEYDNNHDGKRDGLELSVKLPLLPQEVVQHFVLIASMMYTLQSQCAATIEGGVVVQHSSSVAMASLTVLGDVALNQRRPLPCPYFNDGGAARHILLPSLDSSWTPHSLLSSYWLRNETIRLSNEYVISTPGPSDALQVKMSLKYVEQELVYVAGFWYIVKHAWMQYLSVLIVVLGVMHPVKRWVFSNQILPTSIHSSHAYLHSRRL